MSSNIYPNVFTKDEIDSLIKFYKSKEVKATDYWSNNKYLEYQIPTDFSHQILNPKITKILGAHDFFTGSYKECIHPYGLHVDSYEAHIETNTITGFSSVKKHNKALLIPLVEGSAYKTVTFNCYSLVNQFDISKWHGEKNLLDPIEFLHETRDITLLPVDIEYSWRLGDILTWDRDQLHISADFTRTGVTKKFLILFIA